MLPIAEEVPGAGLEPYFILRRSQALGLAHGFPYLTLFSDRFQCVL
jgi:hypothetical protein